LVAVYLVVKKQQHEGRGTGVSSTLTPLAMIDKSDYKYVVETPDADFSPKRNKMIIENTIRKYDETRKRRMKDFREGIGERSEAIASFLKHIDQTGKNKLDGYFTPQMLAHLRGAEIIDKLREKRFVTKQPFYTIGGVVKNTEGVIVGKEISNATKKLQRKKKLG